VADHFADMKNDLPFAPSGQARKARSRTADESELPVEEMRGELRDAAALLRFIEAGRAILTVRSRKTGARFTLRLSKPNDANERASSGRPAPIFVNLLSGADNTSDYTYLGCLWRKPWGYDYAHGRNSRIAVGAPSVLAVRWLVKLLNNAPERIFEQAEFWHEGRCGRCGRRLTVPESVKSGFGPECASKVGL
jgi:hypothetical protein